MISSITGAISDKLTELRVRLHRKDEELSREKHNVSKLKTALTSILKPYDIGLMTEEEYKAYQLLKELG